MSGVSREKCEQWIKNFLPLLVTIVRLKKYPAETEDGKYFVLTFKSRGSGIGKGGRNMVPDTLMPARRKFLYALRMAPDLAERYGLRYVVDGGKRRLVLVRKEVVESFPSSL